MSFRELAELVDGDAPICYGILKPGDHVDGGIPVVKVRDFGNGSIATRDLLHTSPTIEQQYRRSRLKAGDILLSIRGTTGRVAFVPCELDGGNITQDSARIRVPESNRRFVYHALRSPAVQRQIEENTIGQAVKGINIAAVRRLRIPWLPKAQRDRCAAAFDQIDAVVRFLGEVLAAKREMKHGLMQELLTGRRRFSAFGAGSGGREIQGPPDGWDVLSLTEVAEIRVSSVDKHSRAGEPAVRLCNYMDVWTRPFITDDQMFMQATASMAEMERFRLQPGDILLTKDSETREEIAEPAAVLSAGADLVLGYHVALVRPEPSRAVGAFVAAQLRLPRFRQHFVRAAQGATRFGLTLDALQSAPVWLPSVAEQKRIAELDLQLHREIELLEAQRDQFDLQKRALMQKLLSGEVEIHADESEGRHA